MSARDRQMTAARALVDLLSRDLPPVCWVVSDTSSAGKLDGQIPTYVGTPEERAGMLRRWAEALDSVAMPEVLNGIADHFHVVGEHMGAQVTVWTYTGPDLVELVEREAAARDAASSGETR